MFKKVPAHRPANLAVRCAGSTSVHNSRLRQVITERGEHHPVQSVRRRTYSWSEAHSRPGIPVNIGELRSPLHPALRTVVELVPEAKCGFRHYTSVGRATRKSAGEEPTA